MENVTLACPTDFLYHHFGNLTQFRHDADEAGRTTRIFLEISPYAGIAVGLVVAHAGFKIVKPVCGVIGFALGSAAAVVGLQADAKPIRDLACEAELVLMLLAGTAVAILASCLVRIACFLIGAAGGGGVVMLVFHMIPSLDAPLWSDAPLALGHTLVPYWACVAVVGLVGGLVCRRNHREMVLVATTALGALGTGVGARHLVYLHTRLSQSDSQLVFYCATAATAFSGLAAQCWLYRRKRDGRRPKQKSSNVDVELAERPRRRKLSP